MLPEMREPDSSYPKADTFAKWYALDYFRRRPRLFWWKKTLSSAALLFGFAWIAVANFFGYKTIFQSGPLADKHVASVQKCQDCHASSFVTASRFWNPQARSVPDQACANCHQEQAKRPIHHPLAADQQCVVCHQEHRGRAALARVPDEHCAACHGDLRRADGSEGCLAKVTDFVTDHPEFAVLRNREKDSGVLYFNHKLHLQPDLVGGRGALLCSACHSPGPSGHFMQPINYQSHCARCHPLAIAVTTTSQDKTILTAAERFRSQPARHQAPSAVRAALQDQFAGFVKDHPGVAGAPLVEDSLRQVPGRSPSLPQPKSAPDWATAQREIAERVLFAGAGGCRLCHVPKMAFIATGDAKLPEYEITGLQRSWMPRAFFSHAANGHLSLDCNDCHAKRESTLTADLHLPSITSCRECHAPSKPARFDCALCHRYHQTTRLTPR